MRAYIIKIWLFLLYLPNCWSICNQTRFDSTTYKPECPCGKNWITALKVKNVSEYLSGDIFWTTKHFVTKLGMVMLQNEPECHAKQKLFAVFKVKVTPKVKNVSEFCFGEPQNILSPNLVWWCCRMSQSVTQNKNCLLSSRSWSQRGLILSKHYSDYYIFWTADSLATRRGLMISHHRPECLVEKLDYCSQGQGHSKGSKCRCLSRWYFLNRRTFCYQTRYRDAS